jgi:hypothetical protein
MMCFCKQRTVKERERERVGEGERQKERERERERDREMLTVFNRNVIIPIVLDRSKIAYKMLLETVHIHNNHFLLLKNNKSMF